jgi:hypothetical protein
VENNIAQPHSDGSNAGVAITQDVTVSMSVQFVLYSDDLTLFETTAFRMLTLIDRLSGYAKHKGLTVNVGKCAAMVCRTPQAQKTPSPTVLFNGQAIPSVNSFKFLGLHVTKPLCMTAAAKRMKPAVYHAWREIWQEAVKKGVAHMPHVVLNLIQTYVLPSAMINCQVWGPNVLGKTFCGPMTYNEQCFQCSRDSWECSRLCLETAF